LTLLKEPLLVEQEDPRRINIKKRMRILTFLSLKISKWHTGGLVQRFLKLYNVVPSSIYLKKTKIFFFTIIYE